MEIQGKQNINLSNTAVKKIKGVTGVEKENRTRQRSSSANRNTSRRPNNTNRNNANRNNTNRSRVSGNSAKQIYNKRNAPNFIYKKVGVVLSIVLLITILWFTASILSLNVLPFKYVAMSTTVLLVIWLVIFMLQVHAKKKAIISKVISVLMIISLCVGTFYLSKTNNMLKNITSGNNFKIDEMAVVVLVEDEAEVLLDTANYNFGVQYALKGEDVEATIEHINEELNTEIKITEYKSIAEQAEALLNGEVEALIYNTAYASIIDEEIPEYTNLIKIVYSYKIEKEIEVKEEVSVDVSTEPFSIYISGIDVYGSIQTSSRSDVNIICYVNPDTRQILLVTTPRDYYVTFPGITGGSKDKLTHAGIYGVNTSMDTLSELYDSTLDYYARVNFTSLITMVDALGGISVHSEQSFTTSDRSLTVSQGMNNFTGKQALAFSRERYNVSGGDNQRGKNQQAVITAMIEKAVSPAIITGATKLITSVSGNVDTDMPQSDLQKLIKNQISDGGTWSIKSMAATGTGDSQYCYSYSGKALYVMQPNIESVNKIKEAIKALENGEILTDEMVGN